MIIGGRLVEPLSSQNTAGNDGKMGIQITLLSVVTSDPPIYAFQFFYKCHGRKNSVSMCKLKEIDQRVSKHKSERLSTILCSTLTMSISLFCGSH